VHNPCKMSEPKHTPRPDPAQPVLCLRNADRVRRWSHYGTVMTDASEACAPTMFHNSVLRRSTPVSYPERKPKAPKRYFGAHPRGPSRLHSSGRGASCPASERDARTAASRGELFDGRGQSATETGERVHREVLQPAVFNARAVRRPFVEAGREVE
jgi:hypothetical protein